MVYAFFALGLVGLWIGAELVTYSSLGIAHKFKLSETFVGATILAFGTDLPEIMVSLIGGIEQRAGLDRADLVIGNIIGSNMGQIALVLGIAGLLRVIHLKKKDIVEHGVVMVLSVMAFILLAMDGFLSPTDGLIFLALYIAYLILINNSRKAEKIKSTKKAKRSLKIYALGQIVGIAVVAGGSHLVLSRGVLLAEQFGVSEMIIGVVLIGLGSSLPELVVSINALLKGSVGLSVGNLMGSNIVDILLALGLSAQLGGWRIARSVSRFDLSFLLMVSLIVVSFLWTRRKLERKESVLLLFVYFFYIGLKLQGF